MRSPCPTTKSSLHPPQLEKARLQQKPSAIKNINPLKNLKILKRKQHGGSSENQKDASPNNACIPIFIKALFTIAKL